MRKFIQKEKRQDAINASLIHLAKRQTLNFFCDRQIGQKSIPPECFTSYGSLAVPPVSFQY